jgi:hypothetical protein
MWQMYGRRRLTRLELGLYSVIIGIGLAVFLDRLYDAMELAERAAMEGTVNRINTAITIRLTQDLLTGRSPDMSATLARNPFDIARAIPPNYGGEVVAPNLAAMTRGVWVYELSKRELVYLPRLKRGLETVDGIEAIRFRLVASKPGGRYMLVPTSDYTWQ